MEVRRGTLKAFLRTHLPPHRNTYIMRTLEPYFQMVQNNHASVSLSCLSDFKIDKHVLSDTEINESLIFALRHSFMKNLCDLMKAQDPSLSDDEIRKFYTLITEWILCEFVPANESRKAFFADLITKSITRPHT